MQLGLSANPNPNQPVMEMSWRFDALVPLCEKNTCRSRLAQELCQLHPEKLSEQIKAFVSKSQVLGIPSHSLHFSILFLNDDNVIK